MSGCMFLHGPIAGGGGEGGSRSRSESLRYIVCLVCSHFLFGRSPVDRPMFLGTCRKI